MLIAIVLCRGFLVRKFCSEIKEEDFFFLMNKEEDFECQMSRVYYKISTYYYNYFLKQI